MPIYEYRCEACGAEFEKLLRSNEEQVACPECSSESLERLLSSFAARVAVKMPACEGAVPGCSESKCKSGRCGLGGF